MTAQVGRALHITKRVSLLRMQVWGAGTHGLSMGPGPSAPRASILASSRAESCMCPAEGRAMLVGGTSPSPAPALCRPLELPGWGALARAVRGPFEAGKFVLKGQRQCGFKASLLALNYPSSPIGGISTQRAKERHPRCRWGPGFPAAFVWQPPTQRWHTARVSDFNDFLNSFCFLPRGK